MWQLKVNPQTANTDVIQALRLQIQVQACDEGIKVQTQLHVHGCKPTHM